MATWQAHVEQIEGNAIEQLFADKLKDRTGVTPKINKPFLYHYIVPYGNGVQRSGRIDIDGKYTETGYKNENESFGMISNVLPNEVRNEVIAVN